MTQKKMENGSKLLISDFIFRNRFCLAFLTVIIFLLTYGFTSYATQTQTGTIADMDLYTYYGISSPVFFTRDNINSQVNDSSVLNYSIVASTGASFDAGYFDGTKTDAFTFVSSVNGQDVDWTNGYHVFGLVTNGTSSTMIYDNQDVCYLTMSGTSLNVHSSAPFKYVTRVINNDGSYVGYEYDNAYSISYSQGTDYYCGITMGTCFITDMPLNIASFDSSTGFSNNNNYDVFSASNYQDFNYLLSGGLIIPDYPNNQPSVSTDAKHYLNNSLTTKYEKGNNGLKIWEYWTFNDYVRTHPSEFLVSYDWSVYFHDGSNNDPTITTYSSSFQGPLYQVMLNGNNFDSKMVVDRSFRDFVNGQFTLQGALDHVVTEVSGTLTNYQTDMQAFGGTDSIGLKIDDKYEYSYEQPKGIDTFYIVGVYRLIASDGTPSGVFTDRYDFLDGSYEILANEIVNNFDPPSGDMLPSTISPSSGLPSSNNYNAPVANGGQGGNVVVYNNGGLSPAFQIDDVNIANVAQTMNDVVSFFGNDRNQNGFWSLMKSVYDYLPAEIWTAIAVGVSTVLGISIVKVTLSYVRK